MAPTAETGVGRERTISVHGRSPRQSEARRNRRTDHELQPLARAADVSPEPHVGRGPMRRAPAARSRRAHRPRRPARVLLVGLVAACALLVTGCFGAAEPGAPGLITSIWVDGLSRAWDLAFPRPACPSTPRTTPVDLGPLRRRRPSPPLGRVSSFDGGFSASGEGGLMGLAIDPAYGAGNLRAYVCYSTTTDNRVARFDLNPGATPAISNWTVIIQGLPHNPGFHNGCRVRFQPGPARCSCATGDARDRDRAAGRQLPRRQDPPGDHRRHRVARQRLREALVLEGSPQPPGHRLPPGEQRPVLGRARARRERRGQQARERRQRGLEPERRRRRLRPVQAHDRPRGDRAPRPGSPAASPSLRRGARSSSARSGRRGTARWPSPASTAARRSASACS